MNVIEMNSAERSDIRNLVVDLAEAAYTGRISRFNEVRTSAAVEDLDWEYAVCWMLGNLIAQRAVTEGTPAVDAWPRARAKIA